MLKRSKACAVRMNRRFGCEKKVARERKQALWRSVISGLEPECRAFEMTVTDIVIVTGWRTKTVVGLINLEAS